MSFKEHDQLVVSGGSKWIVVKSPALCIVSPGWRTVEAWSCGAGIERKATNLNGGVGKLCTFLRVKEGPEVVQGLHIIVMV